MKKKSGHRSKNFHLKTRAANRARLVTNAATAVSHPKHQAACSENIVLVNASMVRHETFEGRDHLVVPVIAIKEAVLNGQLALFEEFAAYAAAWEGVPLPIYHPEKDGQRVTANTPDILQKQVVGRLFNVKTDSADLSLKGEMWIDVLKAQASNDGKEIIRRFENGEAVEVSTGYFADLEMTAGSKNGKAYSAIQRNMRPDHLALLPNKVGACNWSMGCGAPRVNDDAVTNGVKFLVTEKDGTGHLPVTDTAGKPDHRLMGAAWAALHNGYRGNKYEGPGKVRAIAKLKAMYKKEKMVAPTANDLREDPPRYHFNASAEFSHDDIASMIRESLMEEDQGCYYYLVDVYNDYFVYSAEAKSYVPPPASPAGLFRRDYSLSDDGVQLGDATAVMRKTSYVEVTDNLQEPLTMTKEQIVQALIDNTATPWKETDRATLLAINEAQLQTLLPADPAAVAKKAIVDSLIANSSTPWKEDHRQALMSFEQAYLETLKPAPVQAAPGVTKTVFANDKEFLDALPNGALKTHLLESMATNDRQRQTLVTALAANTSCKFSKEELQGMDLDFLQKVAASMSVNYAGASAPRFHDRAPSANEDSVPDPPKVLTAPIQAQK